MKPTLGRIVHYCENGHVFAALVIHIEEGDALLKPTINLVFWNQHGESLFRRTVLFSPTGVGVDQTWFWPQMSKPSLEEMRKLGAQVRQEIEAIAKAKSGRPNEK